MDELTLQKLKEWRREVAEQKGVDLFRILPNKVLEDIARLSPQSKEDLLAIKGIKEKKFVSFGKAILDITQKQNEKAEDQILNDFWGREDPPSENKIYSVSAYLDFLNAKISDTRAIVKGEISSVNFRNGHVYFTVKDSSDESLLNCFMWSNNYALSGVDLIEGTEILLHGRPEIYKPYGKLSFITELVELVGEGALKKAYEELKKRLEEEGLFASERKKPIPEFPERIGLITSRDGAVINDFMSNIGQFGYKIDFMDSRVEGASSITDLLKAIDYFSDKKIDVLVIIRGGGSLESLQAFNNETLIRTLADFPQPVICGIGHDKDEPLANFVADFKCSTPSMVAANLNKSWERAEDRLLIASNRIKTEFENVVRKNRDLVETVEVVFKDFYQKIFIRFSDLQARLKNNFSTLSYRLNHENYRLGKNVERIADLFENSLHKTKEKIHLLEKILAQNDPERQLRLGYSLITLNGKILRSCSELKKKDLIITKLSDGTFQSEVKKIFKK